MINSATNYNEQKILVFPSVGVSYNSDGDTCMNKIKQKTQYIRESSVITVERRFAVNGVNINDILKKYVVENSDKRWYNNNINTTVVLPTKEVSK